MAKSALVVVDDLHLIRTLIGPDKAEPILLIDPDAVLAETIPLSASNRLPGGNARSRN
jgi:hypothetical protein